MSKSNSAILLTATLILVNACTGMLQQSAVKALTNPDNTELPSETDLSLLGLESALILPSSPANFDEPVIQVPEMKSEIFYVKVFDNATCDGAPIKEGSADSLVSPGWKFDATLGTNDFYVYTIDKNASRSKCVKLATYVRDISLTPYAPSGLVTDSVSNVTGYAATPRLLGLARIGSTVKIYASNNCSGSPVATGSATDFAWPGILLPAQGYETHQIYTAIDEIAGSVSNCSNSQDYTRLVQFLSLPYQSPTYTDLFGNLVFRVAIDGNKISGRSIPDWGGSDYPFISTDSGATFKHFDTVPSWNGEAFFYDYTSGTIYTGARYGLNKTSNLGTTWKSIGPNGLAGEYFFSTMAVDGSNIYAGWKFGIAYSTDGGLHYVNWDSSHGIAGTMVSHIILANSKIYVTDALGLHISSDGGATFDTHDAGNSGLPTSNLTLWRGYGSGKFVVHGNDIYIPTESGLAISHDGGTSFTTATTAQGLHSNTVSAVAVSGSNVYASDRGSGSSGCLSISHDGGVSFAAVGAGTLDCSGPWDSGSYDLALDPNNSSHLLVATTNGLAISTNGGTSFTMKRDTTAAVPGANVNGMAVDATGIIYIGAQNGVYKSVNNGTSFVQKAIGGSAPSNYVVEVAVKGSYLFASTASAGIAISSDGGATFSFATTAQGLGSNTVRHVFVGADQKVYAATANGVSISSNHGTAFTNYTTGLGSTSVYQVFVDANNVIYAATAGGVSISSNGGISFTNYTTAAAGGSTTFYSIMVDSNGAIFAGASNCLKVSYDGGATWIARGLADGSLSAGVYRMFKNSSGLLFIGAGMVRNFTPYNNGLFLSSDDGVTVNERNLFYDRMKGFASDPTGATWVLSSDQWDHNPTLLRTSP